jgi:hypothetical protein
MSISFNYLSDLLDASEEERNCSLLKLNVYALNELYCFLVSPTGFAKFSKADFIAPILAALKTASYRMPFFSGRVRFLELAFSDLELQNINECVKRLTPLQLDVLESKDFKVIIKPRYFPIIKALRLLPEPITKRYRIQEVEVESVHTASIPTARISYIDLANEYIIVEDDSCSISSSSSSKRKSDSQTISECSASKRSCCESNNLYVENYSLDDDVIELFTIANQPQESSQPLELFTTANQPQESSQPLELFTTAALPQEPSQPVELFTTANQPQESSQPVELFTIANQPQESSQPVELFTTANQPQESSQPVELFTIANQPQESSQLVELFTIANQPQESSQPVELFTIANQPQEPQFDSLYPIVPLHFENTYSANVYPQEVYQQELSSLENDLMLDDPEHVLQEEVNNNTHIESFPLLNQLNNMVDPPVSTLFFF